MDKLNVMYKNLVLLICLLMLCACTNVKWAMIKNETNEQIEVQANFVNKTGNPQLKAELLPNEYTSWVYDQSSWDTSIIDVNLQNIHIGTDKGCVINFNREEIVEKINEIPRQIAIIQQDLTDACASQGK